MAGPQPPSSPLAVAAIALSAAAILLLVLSAGAGFSISIGLALVALAMARREQRRAAAGERVRPRQARTAARWALAALGLAGVAALTWVVLAANGITPSDLEEALRRWSERLRDS